MCTRFHRPMGKPGMTTSERERITLKFAENCEHHGEPFAVDTNVIPGNAFAVAVADPTVRANRVEAAKPKSCHGCANFIQPSAVQDELGWNWGMCAASGRLINPEHHKLEARDCLYSVVGAPRDTTVGIQEMPVYARGFVSNVKVTGHSIDSTGVVVEPQDYPTDREVTEDDDSFGIRAWRRMHDPKGSGKYVDLPIFRTDFFDEEEQALVPRTGDDEHPEWYVDHDGLAYRVAVSWVGVDRTPALWGKAGTGKTELARHMAWMMGLPFERINLRPDTEFEEIAGSPQFSVSPERRGDPEARPETWWKDGILPRRWERTGLFLLDEPNMAPPDVWAFLRPAMDNSKQLVVDDRRRPRDTYAFLIAAMNPAYDPSYVGTRELAAPDFERVVHIGVNLPPEEVERQIIVRSCLNNDPPYTPSADTVDKVMAIARDIRAMIDDGSLAISWAVRPNAAVLALTQFFGLRDAYRMAVADGLEPETAELIFGVVTSFE